MIRTQFCYAQPTYASAGVLDAIGLHRFTERRVRQLLCHGVPLGAAATRRQGAVGPLQGLGG